MSGARQEYEPEAGVKQCPLCGCRMMPRGRDPLVRCLGLVLLYAAAWLLLIWLPTLGTGKAASAAIMGVCGAALTKNPQSWWCPECWSSQR